MKEKRKLKNAALKEEKLKQKTLLEQTPEWQEKQKQIEEEKEQLKKEKRDEYNEQRRLKRLQEKTTKIETSIRSPNFCSVAKFWNSTTFFLATVPAFLKWPTAAFVECFSFLSSKPSCNASYPSTPLVLTWVTTHGPASITVQGMFFPFSSKMLVMPIFLPINPDIIIIY